MNSSSSTALPLSHQPCVSQATVVQGDFAPQVEGLVYFSGVLQVIHLTSLQLLEGLEICFGLQ